MTRYLSFGAEQEPFDIGTDDAGRQEFSFNLLAWKRPSVTFMAEVAGLLVAAGVGTLGATIFVSATAKLPAPDSGVAFIVLRTTGGLAPQGTHNDGSTAYRRPGVRIIATAPTAEVAEALAHAAYDALTVVRNQAVSA